MYFNNEMKQFNNCMQQHYYIKADSLTPDQHIRSNLRISQSRECLKLQIPMCKSSI